MSVKRVNEVLEFFSCRISPLFRARFQRPLWQKYPSHLSDPLEGLALFLEGYAFERQGRDPAYSRIAAEVVVQRKTDPDPQKIWQEFKRRLTNGKANEKVNPLFHSGQDNCDCALCVFGSRNIVGASKEALEKGLISEAWRDIQRVRGVGPKIASFFLRDVAVKFGLPRDVSDDERLRLQPIDVWVRRTVRLLAHDGSLRDDEVGKWVVERSTEPEQANQGIWYFCSQVAHSSYELRRSLQDVTVLETLCEEHISRLESTVNAWRSSRE